MEHLRLFQCPRCCADPTEGTPGYCPICRLTFTIEHCVICHDEMWCASSPTDAQRLQQERQLLGLTSTLALAAPICDDCWSTRKPWP